MKKQTNRMTLIEKLNMPRNVAAVLFTMPYHKLTNAILHGDVDALMALKGIGLKTAEKIIAAGKDHVFETKKTMHVPHYSAPMFRIFNMFDVSQTEMIERVRCAADARIMMQALRELRNSVRDEYGPLQCCSDPVYTSLPRSALSDMLEIRCDTETSKLSLFSFAIEARDLISSEMLDTLSRRQRGEVSDIVLELERNIVSRAVEHGFVTKHGEKYKFFTCSSGQLKKESGYWMLSDCFAENQTKFWGGLTPKVINQNTGFKLQVQTSTTGAKRNVWVGGKGIAMTKVLQYRALLTSSSIPAYEVLGKPIKLRNLICVGEFEKNMTANVLSVSENYEISEGERSDIANTYNDGFVLFFMERVGDLIAQIRGFGMKGCGAAFSVFDFCRDRGYEQNSDCYLVKDVDGVVHDVRKESNIYGIVNTSVFKMLKMFGSWKAYVEKMEDMGLDEIRFCAIAEHEEQTKRLSRQMMQSLFALDRNQIEYLASDTIASLNRYKDVDYAHQLLGESDREYHRRSNLAKLVSVYKDMLAESCVQKELRDRYLKQYNSLMCGELDINGRYHFVCPDPCAIADVIFGKKAVDDPSIGWLKANECYCDSYQSAQELILLRSPHAFMEWTTAYCAKPCPYVSHGAVYTSVHDLIFRILQMDYDGDHLLVIDDSKLIEIVKRIKNEFDIPVIYYEPSVAPNPGPMAMDAASFSAKIVECIFKCKEFNKVGQYSNFVTAAWSMYRPDMSKKELRNLLMDVAIIAAAINHAVDAQKTYALTLLEEAKRRIVDEYKTKPHNERFKNASPNKPNDDPRWDMELLPKGEGVVDRLGDIASRHVSKEFNFDASSLNFNWRMLQHPEKRLNAQINKASVNEELARRVRGFSNSNNVVDNIVLDKMAAGEKIGFTDFLPLLRHLNGSFFAQFREQEDDIVVIKATHEQRVKLIREFVIDFARTGTEAVSGMNDDDALMIVAMNALRMTYSARKWQSGPNDMRRFIFDSFGDLYAQCVLINVANEYQPEVPDEMDYVCAFDPDALTAPPEMDMYYGNEMNDIF